MFEENRYFSKYPLGDLLYNISAIKVPPICKSYFYNTKTKSSKPQRTRQVTRTQGKTVLGCAPSCSKFRDIWAQILFELVFLIQAFMRKLQLGSHILLSSRFATSNHAYEYVSLHFDGRYLKTFLFQMLLRKIGIAVQNI